MAKKISWFLIGLVPIFFFLFSYYTPLIHDDYGYALINGKKILSFTDIIKNQYSHYLTVNGRYPIHVLVQVFTGIFPKLIFDLLHALIFSLFIFLINKLSIVKYRNDLNPIFLSLIIGLIWFFIPNPGITFFYIAGGVNYLWSMTVVLGFIYLMFFNDLRQKKTLITFVALVGFFAGWSQESTTIGLVGSIIFYVIMNRKKIEYQFWIVAFFFCLGLLLLVFAPGTFVRIQNEQSLLKDSNLFYSLLKRILNFIIFLCGQPSFLILILISLLLLIKNKSRFIKHLFSSINLLFISYLLVQLSFVFLLAKPDPRIGFGITTVSIILIIRILSPYLQGISTKYQNIASLSIIILIIGSMAINLPIVSKYRDFHEDIVAQIIKQSDGVVLRSKYFNFSSKYLDPMDGIKFENPRQFDYHNKTRAWYYNKTSLQFLSPWIYDNLYIQDNSDKYSPTNYIISSSVDEYQLFDVQECNLWMAKLPKNYSMTEELETIHYYPFKNKTEELKLHQTFIRSILGTLREGVDIAQFYTISKLEYNLLLLPKSFYSLDEIKSIEMTLLYDGQSVEFDLCKK